MKHFARSLLLAAALALTVAACTTAQTDNFVASVSNFNRGLAAVDQTVQRINATLYANCNSMVTVASSINDLAGQCSKAAPYTSTANAVINGYCQSSAAQNAGIATSVSITAANVSAAKSVLAANKKACAS